MRKYSGEQDLIWGDTDCEHEWGIQKIVKVGRNDTGDIYEADGKPRPFGGQKAEDTKLGSYCSKCGAWRGAYGLEPTPEMYVSHTVEILSEIKRVLRKDGVVFLNLGDSYYGSQQGYGTKQPSKMQSSNKGTLDTINSERKPLSRSKQHKRPTLVLKPEDAAWLAAFVDGEGSLMIHKQKATDKKKPVYQANIQIAMSTRQMLDKARSITGLGDVIIELKRKTITNNNPIFRWSIRGQQAIPLIEAIYPYLILKRKQARLLVAIANDVAKRDCGNGRNLTDAILLQRELWYKQVKGLNAGIDCILDVPEIETSYNQLKPKDLCLIPFRVAIAAQESGWWVRSVIIWSKPNPMPESVKDRPTESHEYILMLTKSSRYYWDQEAVREVATGYDGRKDTIFKPSIKYNGDEFLPNQKGQTVHGGGHERWPNSVKYDGTDYGGNGTSFRGHSGYKLADGTIMLPGRNIRSVWEFPTQPYPEAHFAVFPEKLPELCIKAATPEYGCCSKCGTPYERIIENTPMKIRRTDWNEKAGNRTGCAGTMLEPNTSKTTGWQPGCNCNADKSSSIVLDPFAGAGTTLKVAAELNRMVIGYELSDEYCRLIQDRNRQQVLV